MKIIKNIIIFGLIAWFSFYIGWLAHGVIIQNKNSNTLFSYVLNLFFPVKSDNKKVINEVKKKNEKEQKLLNEFTELLFAKQYVKALENLEYIYGTKSKEKYRQRFYKYLQNPSIATIKEKEDLLELYLNIDEYQDIKAIIILKDIYHEQQKYEKKIDLLYTLQDMTHEQIALDGLQRQIRSSASLHVNKLIKENSRQKIISFLESFTQKEPDFPEFFYHLAVQYFFLEKYTEAEYALRSILYDSTWDNKASNLMSKIENKLEINDKYSFAIKLLKKDSHFLVRAIINDYYEALLLLDTGASITTISHEFLKKSNIDLNKNARPSIIKTAGGNIKVPLIKIDSLGLDEMKLKNVWVGVVDLKDFAKIDGLLGMNYLKHFDFHIDQSDALLYLSNKK